MSRLRLRTQSAWRLALLVLVALGVQNGLTSVANASCGDWLAHEPEAALQQPVDTPAPRDVPSPCSGGECRQAPDFPLPLSPQRSVWVEWDHWGTLQAFDLTLKRWNDRYWLAETLLLSEGLRLRPERPPRT